MLKYGSNNIGKVYLGSNLIGKAYLGSNLVYQSGPSGPIFYDNLVFDGTAYIDTNYILPSQCSIRVILGDETLKDEQRVFVVGNSSDGYIGLLYGGDSTRTRRQLVPFYDSSNYIYNLAYSNFSDTRINIFMTPNLFGYADTSWAYTKGNIHPNYGLVFGSNTNHNGQPYTGIMGTFYVYGSDAQNVISYSGFDSYTPVATFHPCTYNGEAGMWHVEIGQFYGNTAGSGTLTVSNN